MINDVRHSGIGDSSTLSLGILTLKAFLAPSLVPHLAFPKTQIDDAIAYFPSRKKNCIHCSRSSYVSAYLSVMTQIYASVEPPELSDIFNRIQRFTELGGDQDLIWVAALESINHKSIGVEQLQYLGPKLVFCRVPSLVSKQLGKNLFLACKELVQKTKNIENMPQLALEETLDNEISRRNSLIDVIQRPIPDLTSSVPLTDRSLISVLISRTLLEEDKSATIEVLNFLEQSSLLTDRELTECIDHCAKFGHLDKLKQFAINRIETLEPEQYFFAALIAYVKSQKDYGFGGEIVAALKLRHFFGSKVIFGIALELITLYGFHSFPKEYITDDEITQLLDYRTYSRLIYSLPRRGKTAIDDFLSRIKKLAIQIPDKFDPYLVLEFCFEANEIEDAVHSLRHRVLEIDPRLLPLTVHNERKFSTLVRFFRDNLDLLLFMSDSANGQIKNNLSIESIIKALEIIQKDDVSLEEVISKFETARDFVANVLIECVISDQCLIGDKAPLSVSLFKTWSTSGIEISGPVFSDILRQVIRFDDQKVVDECLDVLFSTEDLHSYNSILNDFALYGLRMADTPDWVMSLVSRLRMHNHPMTLEVKTLYSNEALVTGEYQEFGTLTGPLNSHWDQLAVIFDDVVHELSQPLTVIGNELYRLENSAQMITPKDRSILERAIEAKNEILDRIDSYKTLVEGGALPTWFAAEILVERIIDDLRGQLDLDGIKLTLDKKSLRGSSWVLAPQFQMKMAMRNLIRNAIAALRSFDTKREKRIRVTLRNRKGSDSELLITVDDNGPGIPSEIQDKIFEKGFTTKGGRGLGLGLPLVATVAKQMGGSLNLDSTSSKGTRFLLVLPSSANPVTMDENLNESKRSEYVDRLGDDEQFSEMGEI